MPRAEPDIESLPFAFAAAVAPTMEGELQTTTVRALRHGPGVISLEFEGNRSVGLTIWSNGNAEMTWMDGPAGSRPRIQQYVICSEAELDLFLHDLRLRLHG
jgi:hypothetical protein